MTKKSGKIAVVGGGIFGICTALKLSEENFYVDLFEKYDDILKGASSANQLRSHRGYHYPRSPETIISCQQSTPVFEETFSESIITHTENFYSVASEGSLVSAEDFLQILDTHSLPYTQTTLPFLEPRKVALTVKVKENLIDIFSLKATLLKKLNNSSVHLFLNSNVTDAIIPEYDFVVVAGYASMNEFFIGHEECQSEYQFEICEKPVIQLPNNFRDISLVVIDGPFFCIDPFASTGLHLAGNVEHAIHSRAVGKSIAIPEYIQGYLNRGMVKDFPNSRAPLFISSLREFIPSLGEVTHVGSFLTIRTVLPHVDSTDERLTIVRKVHPKVATIFSGKIGSCVVAANEVVQMVKNL